MLGNAFDADRLKCAGTDVQRDVRKLDAATLKTTSTSPE